MSLIIFLHGSGALRFLGPWLRAGRGERAPASLLPLGEIRSLGAAPGAAEADLVGDRSVLAGVQAEGERSSRPVEAGVP